MFIALNEYGKRVSAESAIKGNHYFCPVCGSAVILKQGTIKTHHFAHEVSSECELAAQENEMCLWHKQMQSHFPLAYQEVIVWDEHHEKCHIADVLLDKRRTVFEFQHSSISREEFTERSLFYLRLGYKVGWVFDYQEKKILYNDLQVLNDGEYGIHFIWPGRDRVQFLDRLGLSSDTLELADYYEQGKFLIYFHVLTGPGAYHGKWDFAIKDPAGYRKRYFACPYIFYKTDISQFDAVCYEEDAFIKWLERYGERQW